MMMIDAFAVEGVTELAVDSIFMMPHLGVLSTVHPAAATEVFEKDCLVRLGTCIAPVGFGAGKHGTVLDVELTLPDGRKTLALSPGDLVAVPLDDGQTAKAVLAPARNVDVGAGPGVRVEKTLRGGASGLIFDARGRRPVPIPSERAARVSAASASCKALDLYPE
jgi:hypothetical protein